MSEIEVPQIEVWVNGEISHVAAGWTIEQLLLERRKQKGQPESFKALAVEINGELLPCSQYASTKLCDADQIEVVTLVGGG